ncbi:hypothetical protein MAPG_02985 [Magnaporthiopsis poae ATCC 64411]|uniref:Uncharacterized protein n=1 Tax=Magnaporthiopsis poae (strain ATCC 64411 / 73-15) TaxID=644358 RepID=A0A0C4DSU4_MAGP6|nr:hypothetical protein MAPG_02985 [Magnaporthiopsis poae ATCC 64411]
MAKRGLASASIYLVEYALEVLHIPRRLNLVPDAVCCLPTLSDPKKNTPTLDIVWNHVNAVENCPVMAAEAKTNHETHHHFIQGYEDEAVYDLPPDGGKHGHAKSRQTPSSDNEW